MMVPP